MCFTLSFFSKSNHLKATVLNKTAAYTLLKKFKKTRLIHLHAYCYIFFELSFLHTTAQHNVHLQTFSYWFIFLRIFYSSNLQTFSCCYIFIFPNPRTLSSSSSSSCLVHHILKTTKFSHFCLVQAHLQNPRKFSHEIKV